MPLTLAICLFAAIFEEEEEGIMTLEACRLSDLPRRGWIAGSANAGLLSGPFGGGGSLCLEEEEEEEDEARGGI